ncbi:unnamed protein product [Acanthosepion pharaonis]|uniref:Uncharacterized protein n=1 Tax=Acanthosepion pharaonis TaxID=158019 RepID=A0A812DTB6_ACAPH|nr:unnamed protein product [Sepia pharaonis]
MCQKLGFCSYTRCISLFISLFFFSNISLLTSFLYLSIALRSTASHSHSPYSPFFTPPAFSPLTTFSMIALPSLFLLFLSSCHPFFVKVPLSSFLSLKIGKRYIIFFSAFFLLNPYISQSTIAFSLPIHLYLFLVESRISKKKKKALSLSWMNTFSADTGGRDDGDYTHDGSLQFVAKKAATVSLPEIYIYNDAQSIYLSIYLSVCLSIYFALSLSL